MALTRDFKETIRARATRDPAFRRALLKEAMEIFFSGDTSTGKAVLRDYIKATIGFETLGRSIDRPPKSLMRMLGPKGNPSSDNLFRIVSCLQKNEGISLKVQLDK